MRKKNFVTGAAVLGIAGLIAKIIGAFYRVPLTNIIGEDGMGVYQIAYPIYTYLLVISSSGIPAAISRMVSERTALGDYLGAKKVFSASLRILLVLGAVTCALLAVFGGGIAGLLGDPLAADAIRYIAPALLLVAAMSAYRGYFQGMQSMAPTAVSQILEQAGKLGLGLYLASRFMQSSAHLGRSVAISRGAAGAMLGVTLSELAALVFMLGVHRGRRGELERMIPLSVKGESLAFKDICKRLAKIAVPITIGASIVPLMGLIDAAIINNQLMSTGYTQEAARSLYGILTGVVNTLVNMPAVLTVALCMSLVPAIAESKVKKQVGTIKNRTGTAIKLSMIVGMPCAVGLYVLAEPVIKMLYSTLNDQNLALAVELLQIMCMAIMFLAIVQTTTGIMQGMGKQGVPVVNLAIGAGIKVVMTLVFMNMSALNIKGAALGSVACYGVTALLNLFCTMRITHTRFKLWAHVIKPLFASAVMGAAAMMGYQLISGRLGGSVTPLLITIPAAVVLYLLALILLRVLNQSDIMHLPGGEVLVAALKKMKLMK